VSCVVGWDGGKEGGRAVELLERYSASICARAQPIWKRKKKRAAAAAATAATHTKKERGEKWAHDTTTPYFASALLYLLRPPAPFTLPTLINP